MSLTKNQFKILFALSDGKGYSNKELAEKVKRKETNIISDLKFLKERKLVIRTNRENTTDGRRSDMPYNLTSDNFISSDELKELMKFIIEDNDFREAFFNSDYMTVCINESSWDSFLDQLKGFIRDPDIKRDISRRLFAHDAIIRRYAEQKSPIDILQWFDALEAYNYYKKYIGDYYSDQYWSNADKTNPDDAKLLRTFLEYDIALSPFTSYPVNDPLKLLFTKPFERLYNDFYLIDYTSDDFLVRRAYLIYSNFEKILKLGGQLIQKGKIQNEKWLKMLYISDEDYRKLKGKPKLIEKNELSERRSTWEKYYKYERKFEFLRTMKNESFDKKDNLINIIKQYIFYWNIASLRMDFIYCRRSLWKKNVGISPEVYHLQLTSDGLRAIDINYKRGNRSGPSMSEEDIINSSIYVGEGDPFLSPRYCYSFEKLNLEKRPLTVDEIANYIEKNLTFE